MTTGWDTERVSTPIVLIAPAMAVGSGYYRPLVAAFEAQGWAASALPRRGFERGEPPASRGNDWSYADEVDAIATAVEAARAEDPARPVLLLGHSLGAQLGVAHEIHHRPSDGLVTVGAAVPHFRAYPYAGLPVLFMGLTVPLATRVRGYLGQPWFGAPGARTLMREWARFVRTGTPPFEVPHRVTTPTLTIQLEGDHYAVPRANKIFVRRFIDPAVSTRWRCDAHQMPEGGSTDHILWVKTPQPIVSRVVEWWDTLAA